MMRHLTDEELLLDFYGEGSDDDRTRTRAHLEQCRECRSLDEELRAVLTAVDAAPITEPPSGFEREMWARVEPLLPVRQQTWRMGWSGLMPRLAVAASIGVLLVAAFAAGRVWDRPAQRPPTAEVDDPMLIERLLRAEVEDHLERSQRMLVELVNADVEVDALAGDRARAADLVAAGRLYRRSALEVGDAEIGMLLEDLERVLVEVANGPADIAPEELARLRRRIDDQDLMFRVRVVAREIRERGWSEGARE
jgi:hypothetical protein